MQITIKELNKLTLEQARELLPQAVEDRLAEGFSLVVGDFGDKKNKTCCPVSALCPKRMGGDMEDHIWAIIFAFDCKDTYLRGKYPEWVKLGVELREKFVR